MKQHLFAVGGFVLAAFLASLIDAQPAPDPNAASDLKPIPDFVEHGMEWLAAAQLENGGWGAGSHAQQNIRDPHAVPVDPATTAFSAMALMRSGSTLTSGPYRKNISSALAYLLDLVEATPADRYTLATVTGTQPQAKLGQNIDVSMVTQFLSEILAHTVHDQELRDRTANALDQCLHKLEAAQDADGSWNSQGGWAGVLQSAMANNALEMAESVGRKVDGDALKRSREYQRSNLDDESGTVRTEAAAGVSLYSIASNQRATAAEAKEAEEAVAEAVRQGSLDAPAVSADNLAKLGYSGEDARRLADAYSKNQAAEEMLANDEVLSGFGNNGGEEFLSYMMTSESLIVSGSEKYDDWHEMMRRRLAKVQNNDGSWSGHHCITSPVFCTAAVILTLTADRASYANVLNG